MELEIITPTPIVLETGEEISSAEIPNLPAEIINSGTLNPARLPESVVHDDELESAITVHQQASDPHPQYATDSGLAAHATGTGVGGHLPGAGITNDHVAPGAAIAWDKLSKSGAAPADVGAAASAHTHTGLPYVGSAAPSSPAVGNRWLDTGDRLTWFWNGSYWLSEQILSAHTPFGGGAVATGGWSHHQVNSAYNLFLLDFSYGGQLASPQDASNYWDIRVERGNAAAIHTAMATVNTSSPAISALTGVSLTQTLSLHLDAATLGSLYFRVAVYKTGSAGNLTQGVATTRYRLAKKP